MAAKLSGSRAACAYDVAEVCFLSYKSHVISASGFRLRPFTPPEDDAAHVVDVLDALTGAIERDGQQVTRGRREEEEQRRKKKEKREERKEKRRGRTEKKKKVRLICEPHVLFLIVFAD